ncbi:hypothetical protein [Mucilaginibacter aquariorum]|uniref:Uncharacterized protein n=1 Tax=Mucilaginibacter aquariorum TaxID=2967225 RepID=A0ABT1SXR2_9SPHI|nr:hypothetical protein [Mucilaginibacter aquariorum]MCQ6956990.1 hypothetical protein [Mucilaginibacter aquariorum]
MSVIEEEVKVRKVVVDPKISLTMMAQLSVASDRVKLSIIKKSKYPSEFVPGYHEIARKSMCDAFASNISGDYHYYFEDFKHRAKALAKEAVLHPKKRVAYKNPFYSAQALDSMIVMEGIVTPLLQDYTMQSNTSKSKKSIEINNVCISSRADLILEDQYGVNQVGFLKFNFSKSKYPADEAAVKLHVLKRYYDERKLDLNPYDCILVDVAGRRVYRLSEVANMKDRLHKDTIMIRDTWELI